MKHLNIFGRENERKRKSIVQLYRSTQSSSPITGARTDTVCRRAVGRGIVAAPAFPAVLQSEEGHAENPAAILADLHFCIFADITPKKTRHSTFLLGALTPPCYDVPVR